MFEIKAGLCVIGVASSLQGRLGKFKRIRMNWGLGPWMDDLSLFVLNYEDAQMMISPPWICQILHMGLGAKTLTMQDAIE